MVRMKFDVIWESFICTSYDISLLWIILLLDTSEIVKASPWQFVIHSNSKDNFKIKIYMDLYAFVCLAP